MTSRFAVEADMLALIAAAAPELARPGAVAAFEVPSAAAVPDVVATVFDQDVIAARAGTGFVTDPAGLAALLALSDALGRAPRAGPAAGGRGGRGHRLLRQVAGAARPGRCSSRPTTPRPRPSGPP